MFERYEDDKTAEMDDRTRRDDILHPHDVENIHNAVLLATDDAKETDGHTHQCLELRVLFFVYVYNPFIS